MNLERIVGWVAIALTSVACIFLSTATSHADPGTTSARILNYSVGARAVAMGEAFTAQADDASSLYWNPAGIGFLTRSEASFMYNQALDDLTHQNLSLATPLEFGGIGASLSHLSYGQIKGFDTAGTPTGDVNANSSVASFSGAWLFGDLYPLSVGFTLKGIRETLADEIATGIASDVGAIFVHPNPVLDGATLRLGATIRHLGPGMKFLDQRDPLPREYRLGAAVVQALDKKLNISIDLAKQQDVRWGYYAGAEYWLVPMIALRSGYAGTEQEGNGARAGIGLKIKDFTFDYAYGGFGDLGMMHRYEVTFRFGAYRPILTPEERALLRQGKQALARGFYDEAAMVFDTLVRMEPRYRPAKRLFRLALKGYEGQETAIASGSLPGSSREYGDYSIDVNEMAALLALSEDTERVALQKSELPTPESEALAPLLRTPQPPAESNTEIPEDLP